MCEAKEGKQDFDPGFKEHLKRTLKELVYESVRRCKADSLLLSGGLDSAILAFVMSDLGIEFVPICVSLEKMGEDRKYAEYLASILGIKVLFLEVSIEEAISSTPEVIKILASFDPAIPNDLTVYFGMRKVRELNLKSAMTGDGSDEIFLGYDYMRKIEDLDRYIEELIPKLNFNSGRIGSYFGIDVKRPFLDRDLVEFSRLIPSSLKIRDGFGKWILREAFRGCLPEEVLLQGKRPLEVGSGMATIRERIAETITEEYYVEKMNTYGMRFYGKDHLFYYEVYRKIFGDIRRDPNSGNPCPNCGSSRDYKHCRVCGYFEDS